MNAKETLKKFGRKITPAYITKVALLTGIAYVLYVYAKIKLPFMFPSFLEMQISELPAILAGFSLGPDAGIIVSVLRVVLKFHTSTGYVGELTDIILGILYVLPASIIYTINKSKKNALIGLITGTIASTIAAMFINRFVSVPFYVEVYFNGDFGAIVGMLSALYPNINEQNFYAIYLFAGVLPFNILRLSLVSALTFLVYKRLSKALHWEFKRSKSASSEDSKKETESPANAELNDDKPDAESNQQTDKDENLRI